MAEYYNTIISELEKLQINVEQLAPPNHLDYARDPKNQEIEDATREIDRLREQMRGLRSKNVDDLFTIKSLEEKLKKKEEEGDVVKSRLTQMEEELYDKEREIFEAIMTLSKNFPKVNGREPQDERRTIGTLDFEIFWEACLLHKVTEKETESITRARAGKLYKKWKGLLASEETGVLAMNHQLNQLRVYFGDDIYHYVRKVVREVQVARKIDLFKKPWNIAFDRPKTLPDILTEIPALARAPRRPFRRDA